MKFPTALIGGLALILIGGFAGRELFPKQVAGATKDGENEILLSERERATTLGGAMPAGTKKRSITQGGSTDGPVSLEQLFNLVDQQDNFVTQNRHRAVLEDLQPDDLEELLRQFGPTMLSRPGGYQVRLSLINYLSSKDPYLALDFLTDSKDVQLQRNLISIVIKNMGNADLGAARKALDLITDKHTKRAARQALLNVAAESSTETYLALLKEDKDTFTPNHYGYWGGPFGMHYGGYHNTGGLGILAKRDLGAAENYAQGLKSTQEKRNALSAIANGLAQEDPEAALAWARGLSDVRDRDQALGSALSILAGQDPERAASELAGIKNNQQQANIIQSIMQSWGQRDPEAAFSWLETLPPGNGTTNAYSQAISMIAGTDPQRAAQFLEKIPAQGQRNAVSGLVHQWATQDLEGAREWVMKLENPALQNNAMYQLMSQWAGQDPRAAAEFFTSEEAMRSPQRASQIQNLANRWAGRDGPAALEWAMGLEEPKIRESAMSGVFGQIVRTDPELATSSLAKVSDPDQRKSLIQTIAGNWIQQDSVSSLEWVRSLSPEEKLIASSSAISNLSHNSPEQAVELYNEGLASIPDDDEKRQSFSNLAQQIINGWSHQDPEGAAAWLETLPDNDSKVHSTASLISTWTQYDPPGAAQWIDALPAGKTRDRATSQLVSGVQQFDPASAYDWAETISDENDRYSSVRNVISTWKESDFDAARAAAERAPISEEKRAQLLEQFDEGE